MNTFHKIYGVFCLGQDPEVKYTPSGVAIAELSCASEHSYKKNEEWVKQTEWTRITFFNKTAERIGQYLRKGSYVFIDNGRMQTDKWEDKEGNTRYTTKVIGGTINFLSNWGRDKDDDAGPPHKPQASQQRQAPAAGPDVGDGHDDDIPF
jgi:single-strand DNA-binding protein